jgi:plastocyanin
MYARTSPHFTIPLLVLTTILAAGCGAKDGKPSTMEPTPPAGAANAAKPTGKVITIEMFSDEKGNRFEPAEVEAHRGDVVRFSVAVGVHNVHFLADSNAGVSGLPEPSDMLQLPGQVFDVPVNFASGKSYYFQCDPHAPLGMHGHVKVLE